MFSVFLVLVLQDIGPFQKLQQKTERKFCLPDKIYWKGKESDQGYNKFPADKHSKLLR